MAYTDPFKVIKDISSMLEKPLGRPMSSATRSEKSDVVDKHLANTQKRLEDKSSTSVLLVKVVETLNKHDEMEAIRMVDDLSLVYYTMDSIIQAQKKQIEEAMQEVAIAKDEVEEATKLVQNTIHEAEKKEAEKKAAEERWLDEARAAYVARRRPIKK
ncbi:hypothetical protein COCVIDRAFT_29196 [Bipolaris victoriae FI3]|uniref:Uncharacterized protein n=1 Tax=Bipolaris victoriae (strain FI3) TaxID=930091 RepID=W7E115_BIPV3|nr:hypothetical protein COCVIDRAFT_29196 [Bipolaris victoriae FI3]